LASVSQRKESSRVTLYMTNFDKWMSYTDGLPSPDNYRRWGFLYLIAAALQRRVWCPPEHDKLFANMFVTLVGKPGLGKGGVIRAVSNLLTQHKLEDVNSHLTNKEGLTEEEKTVAAAIAEQDYKNAQSEAEMGRSTKQAVEKALLIPVAADAVTYEALVQSMAHSYRRINFIAWDEKLQKNKMNIYGHSSLCFCLEEIASLFRKHTDNLVNFLIQAYDCGENYEYQTKTSGRDRIRRVCLNFFGGTTPDFMQNTFDEKLLSQGYSSRTFYIFAIRNRKAVFFRPELTAEQRAYRDELSAHVKKLTELYGQVQLDNETCQFLEEWIRQDAENPLKRASKSVKLEAYYARKNIHIMKVAMALHFGETTDMHIPKSTFEAAIALLHEEEKTMHLALMMGNNNPLARTSQKVLSYIRDNGKKNFNELLVEFWGEVRKPELEEVLNFLDQTDQLTTVQEADEITKETHIYYKAK